MEPSEAPWVSQHDAQDFLTDSLMFGRAYYRVVDNMKVYIPIKEGMEAEENAELE